MKAGKVYLIGAGPGDVELLTLKAVRVLAEADVVLIDDLVSREALSFVRPEARIVEVGKRGGCHSIAQSTIHELMLEHAESGKIVARLKGGDPFVFGRGGEEMQCLLTAGVPFEVVSGVTAGIAVPAALGIPVSHRDYACSVTFVAGHTCKTGSIDWQKLGDINGTLVIYMGMANLSQIVAELLAAGAPPTRLAAVIQHGTLPQQRSVVATLVELPAAVRARGLGSPAIVVVGDVVGFANNFVERVEMTEKQR